MRSFALLILLASCAGAPKPGLTVETRPMEPPHRGIAWRTDSDDALAEARNERKPALLFFFAGWSDEAQRMERDVLESPRVRGIIGRGVSVKVNVDTSAQSDLCTVFRPAGGVPAFALFGEDGTLAARWVGFERSEGFRRRIENALAAARLSADASDAWETALRKLGEGDVRPLRELAAALARDGKSQLAARLLLAECREQFYRYRWAGVVDAADLFALRFPGHMATQEVLNLRGRALYRGTGQSDEHQVERVAELIARIDTSPPILGGDGARAVWAVGRIRAEQQLSAIGELAADALLAGVLTRNRSTSEACARAFGRIRDSRLLPDLIYHLNDKRLRYPVRARVIVAMGIWADPAFLEPLLATLGDRREAAVVRIAAAHAVTRIGASHGGLYGITVSAPLLAALDTGGKDLRLATLGALEQVTDAFDLSRLGVAMKDSRVRDKACTLFVDRAGVRLIGAEGERYPSNAPDALLSWWQDNVHRLSWEQGRRRYAP